jgi:molybdopterin molybdotransferase
MKAKTDIDCCADGHDGPALKLADALERILAEVRPVSGSETVAVRAALGRVLHEDVVSRIDVPSHTNSAMDGFAFRASDLAADADIRLAVIGVAAAGRPFDGEVSAGECVRILTGAPMPTGTDTVVMQERVTRDGDVAVISAGEKPGQHVRQAGEDIEAGDVALPAGVLLMPAELGMLASVGVRSTSASPRCFFLDRRRTS